MVYFRVKDWARVEVRGRPGLGEPGRAQDAKRLQDELSIRWLFIALAVVVVGGLLAARLNPHGKFFLGYVLYGLIAVVWIIVPSVLAFWFAKDVAFPTVFRTVAYLERRLHFVAVILLVGFVILLIHLALYPWPNIFHQLQPVPSVHSP